MLPPAPALLSNFLFLFVYSLMFSLPFPLFVIGNFPWLPLSMMLLIKYEFFFVLIFPHLFFFLVWRDGQHYTLLLQLATQKFFSYFSSMVRVYEFWLLTRYYRIKRQLFHFFSSIDVPSLSLITAVVLVLVLIFRSSGWKYVILNY